ncbi:Resolvase, N terminal domain [Chitinophaga jiangningensis]|uniref:Resolvase, N terminal domain n=1 Tax=Chitinophaga jiangningensis TaxID=1419482 RepID=A0A1M6Y0T9_9BACT|nr:recombinase family protein [Chitinophaga jiangningensis]SHL11816.1 Resolvase, N terminal domain [Chitinophaga jiangningensis]
MKADLYIRARCDNRASQFIFERRQEDALINYCQFNKITIREKVFDNCSAGNFQRPGWSKYFDSIKSSSTKPALLLFTSWDRWSRNIPEMIEARSILRQMEITVMPIDTHDSFSEALKFYSHESEQRSNIDVLHFYMLFMNEMKL